jgi:hypothetical protein
MRRLVAIVGAIIFAVGVVGVIPASATHCAPGPGIASCPFPATIVITEGQGLVCSAAGTNCTYDMDDPTWVSKDVSQWNPPAQGLYWPGVGPGAVGPYRLSISGAPNPPESLCVSSQGGAGCSVTLAGTLTAGSSGVGAHCGSSKGQGSIDFRSADNALRSIGTLGWEQSAATILPLRGVVNTTNGVAQNPKPTIIGFSSSRGLTGAGNCGVNQATTGFQVEGMTVTF